MGYRHYLYAVPKKQIAEIQVCKTNQDWLDFAKRHGARYIIRGVRNEEDFKYELECYDYNRKHGGLETVWLPATPELRDISSTKIRKEEDDKNI